MPSKIKILVDSINDYKDYTVKNSVEDRLKKTLDLYTNDLEHTCNRVMNKRRKDIVMKELNR